MPNGPSFVTIKTLEKNRGISDVISLITFRFRKVGRKDLMIGRSASLGRAQGGGERVRGGGSEKVRCSAVIY